MKYHTSDINTLTREQINALSSRSFTPEKIYCNDRNIVEKVVVENKPYVVKHFKKPSFPNNIVYGLFRKSKACRSYLWSEALNEAGFSTPVPVAYTEQRDSKGLFTDSCYISEFLPFPTLAEIDIKSFDKQERNDLLTAVARYILDLHKAGFILGDMNASNIFCESVNDEDNPPAYRFALTDVNRTRRLSQGKMPDIRKSMRAFGQMFPDIPTLTEICVIYSRERGFDPYEAIYWALDSRLKRNRRKRRIKRLKHPLASIMKNDK